MNNFLKLVEKTEKNNINDFLSPDKKSIDYIKALNDKDILKNIQTILNKYNIYNTYKYIKSDITDKVYFFIISLCEKLSYIDNINIDNFIKDFIFYNNYDDLNYIVNCSNDKTDYEIFLYDIYNSIYTDLLDNNINPDNSKNYIIDNKNKIDFISDKILFKISHIVVKNIFSISYNLSDDKNNFNSELFFLKFISVNKDKKNNDYKKSKDKEMNKKTNKLSDIELKQYQDKINKMNISSIAFEIKNNWVNTNYAAKPYIEAMKYLNNINDNYGLDSAKSIVLYALSNMAAFKGDKAKIIKAHLKKMCK